MAEKFCFGFFLISVVSVMFVTSYNNRQPATTTTARSLHHLLRCQLQDQDQRDYFLRLPSCWTKSTAALGFMYVFFVLFFSKMVIILFFVASFLLLPLFFFLLCSSSPLVLPLLAMSHNTMILLVVALSLLVSEIR